MTHPLRVLVADRERLIMQIQNLRHEQQHIEADVVKVLGEQGMYHFFNVNWRMLERELATGQTKG